MVSSAVTTVCNVERQLSLRCLTAAARSCSAIAASAPLLAPRVVASLTAARATLRVGGTHGPTNGTISKEPERHISGWVVQLSLQINGYMEDRDIITVYITAFT